MTQTARVIIAPQGSLTLVKGADEEAQNILVEGAPEDAMWIGPWIVVEPRYVEGVVQYVMQTLNGEGDE